MRPLACVGIVAGHVVTNEEFTDKATTNATISDRYGVQHAYTICACIKAGTTNTVPAPAQPQVDVESPTKSCPATIGNSDTHVVSRGY